MLPLLTTPPNMGLVPYMLPIIYYVGVVPYKLPITFCYVRGGGGTGPSELGSGVFYLRGIRSNMCPLPLWAPHPPMCV